MRPHLLAALLPLALSTLHAKPILSQSDYSVTPKTLDPTTGTATTTVRFRVTETTPGASFDIGRLFITRQAGVAITLTSTPISKENRIAGDARDGHYAVQLDIPSGADLGDWDLLFIFSPDGHPDPEFDLKLRALEFSTTPEEIGAPTIDNFSVDLATADLTSDPARIIASLDVADPNGALPPVLRLAFGSDAREFRLTADHLTAGDETSGTYRYAAWLPPGLPPGSYDWSVVTTDATGTTGSFGITPNSLERIPAGNPTLTITNTGDSEFALARGVGDPPALDALTISPTSLDLSSESPELTGSLEVSDDASGFAGATLFLAGATAQDRIEFPLLPADITSGSPSGGTIDFTLPVPAAVRAGTWSVGVEVSDHAGNTTTYGGANGESLPFGSPEEITLSNPLPTPGPFTPGGFRFSTTAITVTTSPADVGFELDLTDPDATFLSATLTATPFIGAAPQLVTATITPADLASANGNILTYATTLHFPLGAIPGPWTVHIDIEGTANFLDGDIGQIEISSFGSIDTTTPELTSFSAATPAIDVTGTPFTATFTLGLTGFAAPDTGTLSFSNPSTPGVTVGPVTFTTATRTAGDDDASTNTIGVTFPAGTPPGTWYPHLTLTDQYLLSSSYGGTIPFPAGNADTVVVSDTGTAPFAAFVANHPSLTDTSPSGDQDRDNLPNIIELLLGTDPVVPDFPSPVQLTSTGDKLRLTFPVDRPAVDTGNGSPLSFGGQISTTLRTSNPLPARSLSGGLYRIETDITPTAPRFLNLRASQ